MFTGERPVQAFTSFEEAKWLGSATTTNVPTVAPTGPMIGRACATMIARTAALGTCHPMKVTI